jgi:hypothetical protein
MSLFSFPNPVNDAAARTVACGVVVMSVLAVGTGWAWLLVPLIYGFAARAAAGPTLSPLGQFATRVAAPRLPKLERLVPGPPKRFAQGIGLAFSLTAGIVYLAAGWGVARWVLVPLILAASLEAFLGVCLGCMIFSWLMKTGLIPESICEECADLPAYFARQAAEVRS